MGRKLNRSLIAAFVDGRVAMILILFLVTAYAQIPSYYAGAGGSGAVLSSNVTFLAAPVAVAASPSGTNVMSQNVTMPSGCPCYVFAAWGVNADTTNAGEMSITINDGTNSFATNSQNTTGSATQFAISSSGFSPITYSSGALITFTMRASQTMGGTTNIHVGNVPGVGTPTWLQITVLGEGSGSGGGGGGSPSFSAITSGVNDSALMQVGSGAHLEPQNFGLLVNNASWFFNTDPIPSTGPAWTSSTPGGTFAFNHNFAVEITLNSAAGETSPSGEVGHQLSTVGCASGTSCQITVTAPLIPAGYTGYTVYAREVTNLQTMQRIVSCVNITSNCTFGSIPTTLSPPTTNGVMPAPSLAKSSVCPPNVTPFSWVPDANGNLNSESYISEYYVPGGGGGGPQAASSAGIRTFCRPVWFTDQQQDPPGGKNAFVVIDHTPNGVFNQTGNQERSLWVGLSTPPGDSTSHYGLEGIQSELDFNCNGCSITGSPDGEVSVASFQLEDDSTTNWNTTGKSGVIRATYFRNGTGSPGANAFNVFNGTASFNGNAYAAGTIGTILNAACSSSAGGTLNNAECAGYSFVPSSSTQFGNGQQALLAFGSMTIVAGRDYLIQNQIKGLPSTLNGPIVTGDISSNTVGNFNLYASANLNGGLKTSQASGPAVNSASCSGGASQYQYQLVGIDVNGGAVAGAALNTGATCANPLTSGNPATIAVSGSWATSTTLVPQFARIDIYRTGGPMATGKIGSLTCSTGPNAASCNVFSDTGLAASGTVPSANTSGETASAGYFAAQQNHVQLTADFTAAANTSLQTITGLSWNLDPSAKNYSFHCSLMYSQATAAASMQFGIQAATVAPTNINAKGRVDTSTSAQTSGVLNGLATTTATAIVTFTPSASGTVFGADLDGSIEEPANNQGQVINIMVETSNSADLPTVKRGSYCYLY